MKVGLQGVFFCSTFAQLLLQIVKRVFIQQHNSLKISHFQPLLGDQKP